MGILLLRRSTGSILYICLYFPTSAMVMFCFLNYLGWQGSFSSGCEGQTDPPRLDSMPECSSCPEEVILQVPRPRIEPRTLATTPGHFTTTLLGRTKVRLRSQPDVLQSQNLRHHASHNHAIKFCDLPWGWPKCSVKSQVVSHLTRGTRFESRLGCSQTYAFWGDKVLSRLAVKDRQVLHV